VVSDFITRAKRKAITKRVLFLSALLMALVGVTVMGWWVYTRLFIH